MQLNKNKEENHMPRRVLNLLVGFMVLLISVSVLAADKGKDEETLKNAESVLQAMLSSNSVPADLLKKAECVIVLPGVKKFGIGIGGSGGRGPMMCRIGKARTFSAPAMYSIGGVSAGLQVGGSSTDYVLLVMTKKGLDALLKSKTKLGNEATAAAGPSGATHSSDVGSDLLTYGRAKGLFAGTSLGGATLEPDKDANQRLYGNKVTLEDIVIKNSVAIPEAAKPLDALLNKQSAKPAETAKPPAKKK
jgi:lipid-binding SYLF domain-containing protein